jgi:hypothetical protein
MTPLATATPKEPHLKTLPKQCRKRHPMANQPLLSWRKTCVSIPKEKQSSKKILSELSRLATLHQTSTPQTAVCNAATSLDDKMHEHVSHKEKAGIDNKTLPSKVNACLNIQCPMRPLTHLIATRTQGQKTHLPLKVLMDPGSNHSHVHKPTLPKGAAPQTPTPARTLNGVSNYNQIVELQGALFPEFSQSKHIKWPFK